MMRECMGDRNLTIASTAISFLLIHVDIQNGDNSRKNIDKIIGLLAQSSYIILVFIIFARISFQREPALKYT